MRGRAAAHALAGVSAERDRQPCCAASPGCRTACSTCATLDGVDYYDDSKATNVGAAVAALDGLAGRDGRVVLIAGGRDKGGDYAPLRRALARARRARVVVIGEARAVIERALAAPAYPVERARDMEDAVRRARALAQPGDAVLLAPACSSFDMFRSYAHRGDVFLRGGARACSRCGMGMIRRLLRLESPAAYGPVAEHAQCRASRTTTR